MTISNGEYVEQSDEKKWALNRFTFFKLVYLYILQNLRDFGFSIQKLRFVKSTLLEKIDVASFLSHITPESIDDFEKEGIDTTF